jgi:hypothetical protein
MLYVVYSKDRENEGMAFRFCWWNWKKINLFNPEYPLNKE